MPDITPGITHFLAIGMGGITSCAIEYSSEWEETEDAEVITSNVIYNVNCENCLINIK